MWEDTESGGSSCSAWNEELEPCHGELGRGGLWHFIGHRYEPVAE